ncbi:YjgN family protein [Thermodesulfobacteriota bacterium]
MIPARYDVVYRGKILPGFDSDGVKSKLMKIFSISEERAVKILKSSGIALKRNTDEISAKKLETALRRIGMEVTLTESKKEPGSGETPPIPPAEGMAKKEDKEPKIAEEGVNAHQASQQDGDEVSRMPFEFSGTGSEYFKIWLVNIILSVITLGIYSAWAKVRRKQYFYGSTKILGSSFEYLADPVKILKGRLIVVGFFIFYSVLSSLLPLVSGIMSLVFILILPWLIVRSLVFNARNSALRNVRFGFKGSILGAAKVYILWPLAATLTLGALFPYVYFRQKKFVVENTVYGKTAFVFTATAREYYRICFGTLIPILIGIVLIALGAFFMPPVSVVVFLVFLVLYLYLFAYFSVKTTNLLFNTSSLSHHRFEAGLKTGEYLLLVLTNSLGIAVTLGVFFPFAKVRTVQYKLRHLTLLASGDLAGFIDDEGQQVSAIGEEVGDFFDMDFGL